MRPSATLARIVLASLLACLAACSRESSAPSASASAVATPTDHPTVIDAPELRERLATRAPALAADATELAAPFNTFAAWSTTHAAASAAERENPAFIAMGLAHARDRRAALKTLIEHDPELALHLAFDDTTRAALPSAFAPLLETRVAATANYDVDIACGLPDAADHASHPAHEDQITRVATINGVAHRAFVYGRRLDVSSKRALPVHGIALDDALAIADSPVRRLASDPASSSIPYLVGDTLHHAESAAALAEIEESLAAAELVPGPDGASAASPWTEGAKTMLYVRVTFSDLPSAEPLTLDQAQTYQANVALFYRQNSYDKVSIATTFTPTLVLPQPESYYNANSWTVLLADARAGASSAGYPTGNYTFYTVAAKRLSSMSWAGRAYIGGSGSHLNGDFALRCTAHEFGHNFGLYHANYNYTSGESPISREAYAAAPENSPTQEYGHRYNMMGAQGSTTAFHFSAREKVLLDWLPPEDSPVILQSGVHRLYRNDHIDAVGLRSLRVPTGDATRSHFWLAYRRNFVSGTYTTPYFSAGAEVLWGRPTNVSGGTLLIDTTPFSNDGSHADSSSADNNDKVDAALTLGRMYGSVDAGAWFTILGQGGVSPAEYLDVAVEVGNFSRNRPPVVSLTPASANVATGQAVALSATATDPDGDAVTLSWDFGDGSFEGDLADVSKSWSAAGHQVVRVTAVDRKGGVASARCVVRVGSPTTFTVSGRVLSGGEPVEGVRVFNGRTGSAYRGTRTDSAGYYTIPNVASGAYTLEARKEDHVFAAAFTNPASVSGDVAGLDFTASTAPAASVIVDNGDPTGVELTATGGGSWLLALSSASGFYANDYITDNNTYKGQKQVVFRPDLPAAGLYRVYSRHAASTNRASNVPVDIAHQAGVATVTVDQTVNGGLWNYLGTFVFEAGTAGFARIRTDNTNGHVCADAFKFEATTEIPPTVRLQTLHAEASELGLVPARLRLEREGPIDSPLTVFLAPETSGEGSAIAGVDYQTPPSSVTFPADVTTLDLDIAPIADTETEGDEPFAIALRQPVGPHQEWTFNDDSGTSLDLAANSVEGGVNWTASIADSFATGSGALRLRRVSPGNPTSWAVLPAAPTATQFLVFESSGWQFTGTDANESVRIGFTTGANSTVVAQAVIARTATGVYVSGEATGTGGTAVAPVLLTTSLTTTERWSVVLAYEPVTHAYRVYFRQGTEGAFTHVGSGTTAPDRVASALRLHLMFSFGSTTAEKFDIGRIALTAADPTQPAYVIASPAQAELVVKDHPRDAWRFHAFDPATLANPAVVAWTADPDGDGLSNLHEYAFGRAPLIADADGLTPPSLITIADARHLAITFTRRTDDPGLVYTPEATGDLATPAWPDAAVPVGESTPYPDTPYESVTVRDPASLDAFPRRFLRVRVELDPPPAP